MKNTYAVPRDQTESVLPRRNANLGHNDDIFPRDVVLFKCLSENSLRFSVGVCVGRVKGVDAVFVPVRDGEVCNYSIEQFEWTGTKNSRKLDVFQPLLLTQHPFIPCRDAISKAS